jgi:hypothetical protein
MVLSCLALSGCAAVMGRSAAIRIAQDAALAHEGPEKFAKLMADYRWVATTGRTGNWIVNTYEKGGIKEVPCGDDDPQGLCYHIPLEGYEVIISAKNGNVIMQGREFDGHFPVEDEPN